MKKILAVIFTISMFLFTNVVSNAATVADHVTQQKCNSATEQVDTGYCKSEILENVTTVNGCKCDSCKCKKSCSCCDKCTCGCKEGKACSCCTDKCKCDCKKETCSCCTDKCSCKCKSKANKKCKCKKGCKAKNKK